MFVVGLTGGIGSGKTAVSDRFKALGIVIVDADVMSRVVVEPGKPALREIQKQFGDDILLSDGSLNRAALRTIIFKNPDDKAWLEKLLHPLIAQETFDALNNATSPYTIFASPLLIEAGQHAICDRILVVDVPESVQLERTMARDSNDADQVKAIIASQVTRSERLAKADDVIENTQGFEHLDREVARLHACYLELARQKTSTTQ